MSTDTTPPESEQPQDNTPAEEYTLRQAFSMMLDQQSQLLGILELRSHTLSAHLEATQQEIEGARNTLRLLTCCEAGLLNEGQQQEMWELIRSSRKKADSDMDGLYPSAYAQAVLAVPSQKPVSTGLQDETIRPTDDLT